MAMSFLLISGAGLLLANKLMCTVPPTIIINGGNPASKYPYRDLDELKNHNIAMVEQIISAVILRGINGIPNTFIETRGTKWKIHGRNFVASDLSPITCK